MNTRKNQLTNCTPTFTVANTGELELVYKPDKGKQRFTIMDIGELATVNKLSKIRKQQGLFTIGSLKFMIDCKC